MPPKVLHNALKPDTLLQRYRIERSLARGSFGMTYLAHDESLQRRVVIKEYFPLELAVRDTDFTVQPVSSEDQKTYQWGLDRFIAEARILAKFNHRNIVRVVEIFERNNTAYLVMNFEEGETLKDVLQTRRTMPEHELMEVLLPILDGLENIHSKGFLHRDIKPANILLRPDGTPLLLDFGSAREALSERTVTTLYSPGFAPIEQYAGATGQQGPWTDIYGLGATLYCAVTGHAPPEALQRSNGLLNQQADPFISARKRAVGAYGDAFLNAIDHALAFKTSERPQSIGAWRHEFAVANPGTANTRDDKVGIPPDMRRSTPGTTQNSILLPLLGSVAVGLLAGGAIFYFFALQQNGDNRIAEDELTAQSTVQHATPTVTTVPVPTSADAGASASPTRSESTPADASALGDRFDTTTTPTAELTQTVVDAPATSVQDEVALELQRAEQDIQAGRLTTPPGNNALEKYQRLLITKPDESRTLQARRRLLEIISSTAHDAVSRGDTFKAQTLVDSVRSVLPLPSALEKISQDLAAKQAESAAQAAAAANAEKARQTQANRQSLMEQTRQAMTLGQYQKATGLLQQIVEQIGEPDGEIQVLQKELERRKTVAQLIQEGRTALKGGDINTAQRLAGEATKIFPKARSVMAFNRELGRRRTEGTVAPATVADSPAVGETTETASPEQTTPDTQQESPQETQVRKHLDTALKAMNIKNWAVAKRELDKASATAPDSLDVQLMYDELAERQSESREKRSGVVVALGKGSAKPGVGTGATEDAEAPPLNSEPLERDEPSTTANRPADGVVVPIRSRRNAQALTPDTSSPSSVPQSAASGGVAIRSASSSVAVAHPGDTVVFTTEYELTLADSKFDYIQATWTLKRNGRSVGEQGEHSGSARAGTHSASTELTLPQTIKPGKFSVEHKIQASVGQATAISHFTVAP